MTKPETFRDLLADWDTLALSAALGVPYVNARKMRERGSVSIVHWPKLIDGAAIRGIRLTYSDLVAMRSRQPAPAKSEAAA